jgi:6,7-dimethyl-8-ribityllumazine synthase
MPQPYQAIIFKHYKIDLSIMNNNTFPKQDGSQLKIAIIKARFNKEVTDGLLRGAKKALEESGVDPTHIEVVETPGAFEIPLAVQRVLIAKKHDAVVTLGCIQKGATSHDKVISTAITPNLVRLSLEYGKPVTLGIINPETNEQAAERSGDTQMNAGYGAAMAAVEMALK